jgi:S-DNA-T family DNA segregation ATPase FtsK/SpoIIIE
VWNEKTRRELSGLALIALALFTLLSLIPVAASAGSLFPTGNIMGVLGAVFVRNATAALGVGAWGLPVALGLIGVRMFEWLERESAVRFGVFVLGLIVLVPVGAGLVFASLLLRGDPAGAAGWLGEAVALPMIALLGGVGAWLVFFFLTAALLILTLGWNPLTAALRGAQNWRGRAPVPAAESLSAAAGVQPPEEEEEDEEQEEEPEEEPEPERSTRKRRLPGLHPRAEESKAGKKPKARSGLELEEFGDPAAEDRPPLTLLSEPPAQSTSLSESELDRLGQVLIQTLRTFKVEGMIAGRTTGPVVTQFEVVPAPGVKVNRIAALDADLALALKAPSVRIVAPIPGKGAVGVDVPNPERVLVHLRSILEAQAFQRKSAQLPLALGQDLAGRPYVADLAKMPHLLIAGATGSGKSICINTLITSLVYRHPPSELRLLMIDPKMVELSMYADLPHLRHPVVTDPQDAATVLKWAVLEMARRYELLSANSARSITEFNRRALDGAALRRAHPSGAEGELDHWAYQDGPLPYIVLVVEELADLMMSVQAEIEKPLAQLAQKARAIGIHLIVATQRPSVNVITGLIKANFPCRIAFRVSSKVDSRTIIDQNGADALLGNGDMLFLPPGQSDPVRIQGAYLATEDTERMMHWYRERAREKAAVEDDILEYVRAHEAEALEEEEGAEYLGERDALFRQAAEVCVQFQQGSTSLLQRRLRIGYGRAARIIDQLHQAGILGPPDGSKPREVLIGLESIAAICGDD